MNNINFKKICLIWILFIIGISNIYAKKYLVFRIDDLGIDDINVYYKIIPLFDKYSVKLTIAVVPIGLQKQLSEGVISQKDIDFIKYYIKKGTIEIAQHGYNHIPNYKTSTITSEFFGINYCKQLNDVKIGKQILEEIFSEFIWTFIPPWNAYDNNTLDALEKLNFKTISAARYGGIAFENTNILYIPYTTNLHYLHSIINSKKQDSIFICLFHAYDFNFNDFSINRDNKYSDIKTKKFNIQELNELLGAVSRDTNIQTYTINELSMKNIDFSNKRFENSMYNFSKITNYLPYINKYHLMNHAYKENSWFVKNSLIIFTILYFILLILLGVGSAFLFIKYMTNNKLMVLIQITIILLMMFIIFSMIQGHLLRKGIWIISLLFPLYFTNIILFKSKNKNK